MKILILHKWLVMGGIEKILISYLHLLKNESDIQIDLVIAFDTNHNVFTSDIPHNVNLHFLFNQQEYNRKVYLYHHKHKNIRYRIQQKLHNFQQKQYCKKKLQQIIDENHYDIIINFSNHFDPYLQFSRINSPLVRWQHSALTDITDKDCQMFTLLQG